MTTLIFVLAWVLLGLGLLLVAFSGGPGGALQRIMSTSRGARRVAIVLFAIALLGLGVGVPAAVITAVASNDSDPEANVSDFTADEQKGRELFGQRCGNCHTLKAANTFGAIGPNLDQLRPPKALVLNAIENGRAQGNGQMAANLYTGDDADKVASFVAKAVGQTGQQGGGGSGGESGESSSGR
jgi:mono/diheme cytochrome c family protein